MILSAELLINCNNLSTDLNSNIKVQTNDLSKNEIVNVNSNVARIFNIQRYSLNDGIGIRTVIFFKGCPHHCPWCSNPESISRKIQLVRRKSKCIHCNICSNDCYECPSGALEEIGYDIDVDTLVKKILQDDVFFRTSGGGVTLSGGEVLLQANFASLLLNKLKSLGINTAIETAGDAKFEDFLSVASKCDEVLFDFKIMNEQKAKEVINLRLPRVLDNFSRLYQHNINLIPRLPLIPNFTLSNENILQILLFLKNFKKIKQIHILPFHKFGEPKYELINQTYKMRNIDTPTKEQILNVKKVIQNYGYEVIEGG